jgi:hypothetical protein
VAVRLLRPAFEAVVSGPSTKFVLVAMADLACGVCGLAWPGVGLLGRHTQLGPTKIREAIDELTAAGHLSVHAFSRGGRGRSTEFLVFPSMAEAPAPCPGCMARLKPSPSRPVAR